MLYVVCFFRRQRYSISDFRLRNVDLKRDPMSRLSSLSYGAAAIALHHIPETHCPTRDQLPVPRNQHYIPSNQNPIPNTQYPVSIPLICVNRDPDRPEITNYKHQITNKLQITKTKSQTRSKANYLVRRRWIGHCDLFGICLLAILFTHDLSHSQI